jgi:hypothetical protein
MPEFLSDAEMREKLRDAIKAAGSQRALAADCCITPQLVSMCLSGEKVIGGRIAKRLGYRRVSAYLPISEAGDAS